MSYLKHKSQKHLLLLVDGVGEMIKIEDIGKNGAEKVPVKSVKITAKPGKALSNQDYLKKIDIILKKNDCDLSCLKGVLVVQGPGGWSKLRRTITLVNTLAWVFKLLVVGLPADYDILKSLKLLWRKSIKRKVPILPIYGGEPSITVKK